MMQPTLLTAHYPLVPIARPIFSTSPLTLAGNLPFLKYMSDPQGKYTLLATGDKS